MVQGQGGSAFQPVGILMYVEDLKEGPNAEIGLKDFFELLIRILTAEIIPENSVSLIQF